MYPTMSNSYPSDGLCFFLALISQKTAPRPCSGWIYQFLGWLLLNPPTGKTILHKISMIINEYPWCFFNIHIYIFIPLKIIHGARDESTQVLHPKAPALKTDFAFCFSLNLNQACKMSWTFALWEQQVTLTWICCQYVHQFPQLRHGIAPVRGLMHEWSYSA